MNALADVDVFAIIGELAPKWSRFPVEDVEEAVADGVLEIVQLAEREPLEGPPAALIRQRARWNMLHRAERAPETSLDTSDDPDRTPADVPVEVDFDAAARLAEDPIIAERRAAMEAGFSPGHIRGWTRDKILAAVKRFARRHGRSPLWRDMRDDPALPGWTTASRHFDTFNAMLEEAGLPTRRFDEKKWVRETADAAFRDFVTREGRPPKATEVSRVVNGLPNWVACKRIYDTYAISKILAEIGVDGG